MNLTMISRLFTVLTLCLAPLASDAAETEHATLHYQPDDAIFGDPIPFYHDGVHHVFYLCPTAIVGQKGKALAWRHLASRDLVHWDILPPAILPDENDKMIATGSIVQKDGLFHAFYTTTKRGAEGPGLPEVRVTTSRDLITWTKELGEPLLLLKRDVPAVGVYDTLKHWRDPHVFWNPDAKEWWLAIAAQEKTSVGYPYAGAVALAISSDLRKWTVQPEPLLSTREGPAGECPDIFPLGDGWAMLYYADTTRIRLASTPSGPWRRPSNDPPWGLNFLAGKTEFDGQRRIAHAYIQRADHDFAPHSYGGSMALPREVYLDEQGRVATRLVSEIIAACNRDATSNKGARVFVPAHEDPVAIHPDTIAMTPRTGAAAMAVWEDAPADFFLTADVTLAPDATLDILIRGNPWAQSSRRTASTTLDDHYTLSLDAHRNLVTLKRPDVWNRMPAMRSQSLDFPTNRPFKLHIMLHGDILEVFVDDRISVTARLQLPDGALALLGRDGNVSLNNLRINKLPEAEVTGWPEQVKTVNYQASIDNSQQPMLTYGAKSWEKRPLLVGLHSWSEDYTQAGGEVVFARWCIEKDWHFIHPHFRGPNWTRDACGSEKVVRDIIDAVEYMKKQHNVDTDRIYLVGGSGGGYASLLMAGRAPDLWAGVSAWVPISDIRAWWEQNDTGKHSKYARHIEQAVGGRPDQNSEAAQECVKRSAITYLQKASGVNLDINAGVTDGHEGGSVPFTHSLYAFNHVVPENNRIDPKLIQAFYEKQALPAGLEKAGADPLYGNKHVIFRKVFMNTRVIIFQSGHDIIRHAALNWLAQQSKGKPANWNVAAEHDLETDENESEVGK